MAEINLNKHLPGAHLFTVLRDDFSVTVKMHDVARVGIDKHGRFVEVGDRYPFRESDSFFWTIQDAIQSAEAMLIGISMRDTP